jgi:hypothetical protein
MCCVECINTTTVGDLGKEMLSVERPWQLPDPSETLPSINTTQTHRLSFRYKVQSKGDSLLEKFYLLHKAKSLKIVFILQILLLIKYF